MQILGGKMTQRLIPNVKPKSIALDFDGVLNSYKGYDGDNLGMPRPGCKEFLEELSKDYNIIIFSARRYTKIIRWLNQYNLQEYICNVTRYKPKNVVCFIDDRGIRFTGDYNETLEMIKSFKTYWE
jgi:hypothetical protein